MSCRIDRVVGDDNRVMLVVSGRIMRGDVDILRDVLEQESDGLAIDLKNVLLVDREAVKFFALCDANGAELRNCPPYVREWSKAGDGGNAGTPVGARATRKARNRRCVIPALAC